MIIFPFRRKTRTQYFVRSIKRRHPCCWPIILVWINSCRRGLRTIIIWISPCGIACMPTSSTRLSPNAEAWDDPQESGRHWLRIIQPSTPAFRTPREGRSLKQATWSKRDIGILVNVWVPGNILIMHISYSPSNQKESVALLILCYPQECCPRAATKTPETKGCLQPESSTCHIRPNVLEDRCRAWWNPPILAQFESNSSTLLALL